MDSETLLHELLSEVDVRINGSRPWDIHVHDPALYTHIWRDGLLGVGESYVEGHWDCDHLDAMVSRVLSGRVDARIQPQTLLKIGSRVVSTRLRDWLNPQRIARARKDVASHYDLGNDLYEAMLDSRMTYTCGYWRNARDLEEAQEHKLDLICRKLDLRPGMRVLDIGCGWASLMNYAAEHYGVRCDGLTLSREQAQLGQQRADAKGLPVRFILQDYREFQAEQCYDRVVSVGMFEHVGPGNYRTFFECVDRQLAKHGLFLLHTIGGAESTDRTNPWINKYIFPNGVIPSMAQIGQGIDGLFNLDDLHNFGPDYDKTLVAWYRNFDDHWPELAERYGERFYRMWRYYLLTCAGAFRCRSLNLWQIALTKVGAPLPVSVREA